MQLIKNFLLYIIKGSASWRHKDLGTFLVQPLCQALRESEHGKEILELITRTQRVITETTVHSSEGQSGQTPEIVYNASQKLFVENNLRLVNLYNIFI
jgi:hypothetical protein